MPSPACMPSQHTPLLQHLLRKPKPYPTTTPQGSPLHKEERRFLIEHMQLMAKGKQWRISFISGDVHLGAAGRLYTFPKMTSLQHGAIPEGGRAVVLVLCRAFASRGLPNLRRLKHAITSASRSCPPCDPILSPQRPSQPADPHYMPQFVSSAIVNAPPPDLLVKGEALLVLYGRRLEGPLPASRAACMIASCASHFCCMLKIDLAETSQSKRMHRTPSLPPPTA